MSEIEMEDTIGLKTLYLIFGKIKMAPYGSSVEIRESFTADKEMVYYAFQKELVAHSRISMN